jgi:hypothetical protein
LQSTAQSVHARTGQDNEADRKRALQLFDEHKLVEAMPILEKLVAANPTDSVLLERFGTALLAYAVTLKDAEPVNRSESAREKCCCDPKSSATTAT